MMRVHWEFFHPGIGWQVASGPITQTFGDLSRLRNIKIVEFVDGEWRNAKIKTPLSEG